MNLHWLLTLYRIYRALNISKFSKCDLLVRSLFSSEKVSATTSGPYQIIFIEGLLKTFIVVFKRQKWLISLFKDCFPGDYEVHYK